MPATISKSTIAAASNQDDIENAQKQISRLDGLMIGVVIVLSIGFISLLVTVWGLVMSYLRDDSNSYQDFRNELRIQNDKIDQLTQEIRK